MNLDRIWEYRLRRAFTNWDRSTEYGCLLRNVPYNQEEQERLKKIWDNLREEHNQYCIRTSLKIQRPSQEAK